MATNIGPKISVEGEAEYRKQMTQIIAQQKALAAEMKATVSGFASTSSAQEKARASGKVLAAQWLSELRTGVPDAQAAMPLFSGRPGTGLTRFFSGAVIRG